MLKWDDNAVTLYRLIKGSKIFVFSRISIILYSCNMSVILNYQSINVVLICVRHHPSKQNKACKEKETMSLMLLLSIHFRNFQEAMVMFKS